MSDRFVFYSSQEEIEKLFNVETERADFFEPHYNIGPGTLLPVVFFNGKERQIRQFKWGLIPEGAGEEKEGESHYAAAAEEMDAEELAAANRCIFPANGFYKWKTGRKKSTPFYVRILNESVMCIAGIYRTWKAPSGREVFSFAILTTGANPLIQPVDERMPVILRPNRFEIWLGEEKPDGEALQNLLQSYPFTEMAVNRVSEKVNNPSNNDPRLIQPIPK